MRWAVLAVALLGVAAGVAIFVACEKVRNRGGAGSPNEKSFLKGKSEEVARVSHLDVVVVPLRENWFAVWVTTKNQAKNAQFKAWTDTLSTIPPLRDDLGNTYPAVRLERFPGDDVTSHHPEVYFSEDSDVRRHREVRAMLPEQRGVGSGQVSVNIARCDMIAFQPLVPKARKVFLTLPAENVGGSGNLTFEFDLARVREVLTPDRPR